ncbi:MAG: acyl-CoA reductase [Bacteroidales bacterium]
MKIQNLENRVEAFIKLGTYIKKFISEKDASSDFLESVHGSNEWFTNENVIHALTSVSEILSEKSLSEWLGRYPDIQLKRNEKKIGLIMAGNIPLVGFHDFLSVLISGHKLVVKLSSKDDKLLKFIVNWLIAYNKEFENLITFENAQLKNFDAVIATGSNNSARYFEYYFSKYPNIIRKNRNSVAILTGMETKSDMDGLADDLLIYFGLGCRNVSKLYIPENFDLKLIFEALYRYNNYLYHNKFYNNFTYNKSIYLMNKIRFWENGFIILKEDIAIASPISVVFFERYENIEIVKQKIALEKDFLQCVVAKEGVIKGSVNFGQTQRPLLWDYADNVDTMKFLLTL